MNQPKKLLPLFVGFCFLFGGAISVNAQSIPDFQDISSYPWRNSINDLKDQQVVEGYGDGTFKPDKKINRAELTKIVIGSRFPGELNGYQASACFSDIETDQWYASYVCLAKEKGIIGGYPDGSFKPSQFIRQGEALKILLLAFDKPIESAAGEWYTAYLKTSETLGMRYFAANNAGGYGITRGEMAYFTSWLRKNGAGEQAVDQIAPFSDPSPYTYLKEGTNYVVKMNASLVKMNILSGNNSLHPKNPSKCSTGTDCIAESQAAPFATFIDHSHKELLVNGSFFDAYTLPLDGINFHQVGSDIISNGEILSMFGYKAAFGNGGMLAQWLDNSYHLYFPIRDWVGDLSRINSAISNYPMILENGRVRTKEEIGNVSENDSKFWLVGRRGGLGLSADGNTIMYVSASGTVEDLGNAMLGYGAYNAFSLDGGASNGISFNGKTIITPGRNLTTVIEFYRYR